MGTAVIRDIAAMLISVFISAALVAFAHARLPYIVNGKDAPVGAWPWQASLQADGNHFCGGAVISDQWILTAAHCVVLGPKGPFQVVLGQHDLKSKFGKPETYETENVIAHANFDMYVKFILNDIALVKLKTKIDFSNKLVQIVPMAEADGPDFTGEDCRLTGWGRTSGFGSGASNTLQQVNTVAITRESCEELWRAWGFKIKDSHICLYTGKGGACQGDSGGPCVCNKDGQWILAGITSGGSPICNVKRPSIYSRVSYYR